MRLTSTIRGLAIIASVGVFWAEGMACAQDISFEVRTKDGRSEYYIGEPISLQLVFTSNSKQYLVDTSLRYPELRRQNDEFLVDPVDGSSDPLEDYRRVLSPNQLYFDNGLRGFGRLGEKPVTLDLFLNRYVQFSKPGRYVLSIRDRRVSLVGSSWKEPQQVVELMSKPLSLTIAAPSAEWQQEQLGIALRALKTHSGDASACEILTTLGTRESELAMANALLDDSQRPGCGFSYAFLGLRNRKLVLENMKEELNRPDTSISPLSVEAMVTLTTLEEGTDGDFFQRQSEARKRIIDELFDALNEKKGPARNAAISTLINESLQSGPGGDSARDRQMVRLATDVFDQLSEQAQSTMLSAKWSEVAGSAIVPVLRRCAEADATAKCGRLQGELLLARLNELSPSDAREVILADMQKEHPRFPPSVLAILPDKELPEMDVVLRERLQSKNGDLNTVAGLIQRYATGAIAGAVESFLDENGLDQLGGQAGASLIAYLLRVQPDAGAQRLRAALAVRNETGWYKYLLRDIAQRISTQKIQGIAIDALSDPDQQVVESAVEALAMVGDERGKMALFQRLDEWRAKWMGREHDMFWVPGDGPITDDRNLGLALINSIATGAGWLLSEEDQHRLGQSAVTENLKQQVNQFIEFAKNRPVPITIISVGFPRVQINVAQYHYESLEGMKQKLLQFPTGMVFQLQNVSPESKEAQDAASEIESFLTQHGMRLPVRKT